MALRAPAPMRVLSVGRKPTFTVFAVDASKGLLKKPEFKQPDSKKLFAEETSADRTVTPSTSATPVDVGVASKAVTIEYQRQRAKEMTKYFKEMKLQEQIVKSQVFGWTPSNEISNGRWVMFGMMVGMMTEYATGVSFVDQIKLLFSYFGVVELD